MMMFNPSTPYVPGTYAKKRPEAVKVAAQYAREWEARRHKLLQKKGLPTEIPPCICFSRKIGVGALEVADILARKLHLRDLVSLTAAVSDLAEDAANLLTVFALKREP